MSLDIKCMAKALESLDRTEPSKRNGVYRQIYNSIHSYLQNYCVHSIITDVIDIDIDRSQTIRYCEHCMLTFE